MYVLMLDGKIADTPTAAFFATVPTLDQAFARICCHCGLDYHFEQEPVGWKLVLTDVERPDRSPDHILSTCIKSRDAKHDLMTQAVDGRIRGHVAKAGRAERPGGVEHGRIRDRPLRHI